MSQTKAQLLSGTSAQDLTVDNISAATFNQGGLATKNLFINGACVVAQRSTAASGSNGFNTLDRLYFETGGNDEAATLQQVDVASGTTPYTLGFRKCAKILNGNQTGGAGASDTVEFNYSFEAQDLATSGWNYKSASSYVTFSFWVKSSVAQNFYGYFRARDGSAQMYSFDTGSLSADTWTKVTKTIPGDSNLTFDNDNGNGLTITFDGYRGTSAGGNGATLHTWFAEDNATRTPAQTTTWYTTNDSTLEFTGMQLEVGDTASSFNHRSYGDELARCQRYFWQATKQGSTGEVTNKPVCMATYTSSSEIRGVIDFPVEMRSEPTLSSNDNSNSWYINAGSGGDTFNDFALYSATSKRAIVKNSADVSGTAGACGMIAQETGDSSLSFSAEL